MIFRLICARDRSKGQHLRLTGRMLCLRCLPRWEPILGKMSQRNDCPRRTSGLRAQVSQGGRDIPLSHHDRRPGVGHWHFFSTGSQNRTKVAPQGHRKEYQYCSGPAGNQTHFSQAQGHTSCDRPFLDIGYLQPVSICCPCPLFVPNLGSRSHVHTGQCAICSPGPRLRPQSYMELRFVSAGALFL